MNLIGEQVLHSDFGSGTILKIDNPRVYRPNVWADFDGTRRKFEILAFFSGQATANRNEVQQYIVAVYAAINERHDLATGQSKFVDTKIRKKYRMQAQTLASGQLQPGETLLCCDKKATLGCFSVAFLLPSLFCLYLGADGLIMKNTNDDMSWPYGVVFLIAGIWLLWGAYYGVFLSGKNHYCITDARLCIREFNAFGKPKNMDIPISTITYAALRSTKSKNRRGGPITYLDVFTEKGRAASFTSPSVRLMSDVLLETVNPSRMPH